ncbi:MAG: tol-pal system protein YbgF [Thermodesulfovibrio sp.]|nr:tol-pal system protein YbgF [Thermodesulfovibrio sp.]
MFRVSAGLLFLLTFAACATNSDMDMLRRDVDNLKRDTFESKKEIDGLKERTARVVKEESFNALRESQGELNTRISDITSGLQELRGRFEEGRYYQEKLLKDSTAEKDLLRAQITGLETQVRTLKDRLALLEEAGKNRAQAETEKPEAEKGAPPEQIKNEHIKPEQAKPEDAGSEPAADKDRDIKPAPEDPSKPYDAAYQLFKDKKYKAARTKFEAFIKDAPKHKLAGNAQFWIAETHYAEKDYENAILAYEVLLKKYPDTDKTGGALLKQGLAFAEIGDKKTARVILEKLIQKYPDSKDSALAKKRLAEFDKKPAKKK